MVQTESAEIDEMILQIFEESDNFSYPIATQRDAKSFVRALTLKGLPYQAICQEIGEFEYNFSSWRKSVGRVGIGKRVIKLLNRQFEELLDDSEEENEYIIALLKKRSEKLAIERKLCEEVVKNESTDEVDNISSSDEQVLDTDGSSDLAEDELYSTSDAENNTKTQPNEGLSHTNLDHVKVESSNVHTECHNLEKSFSDLQFMDESSESNSNDAISDIDNVDSMDKEINDCNDDKHNDSIGNDICHNNQTGDNIDKSISEDSSENEANKDANYQDITSPKSEIIITYNDFSTNDCDNENFVAENEESNTILQSLDNQDSVFSTHSESDENEKLSTSENDIIIKHSTSYEILEIFEKSMVKLHKEIKELQPFEDVLDESIEDYLDENYDSDIEFENSELLQLIHRITKTISKNQIRHNWNVYVWSDSSSEALITRIKIGVSRCPKKRLQQAQLSNPDVYQIASYPVTEQNIVLKFLSEKLSNFSYLNLKNWYEGSLEEMLEIISSISEQFVPNYSEI